MLTPDGRYIVIVGKAGPRLWRAANPTLPAETRATLTKQLMGARRSLKGTRSDTNMVRRARAQVQAAKEGLGERGPVWWTDGAPDLNRRLIKNTPYWDWWSMRRD